MSDTNKAALLIIDIQNDYFPGGAFTLPGADQAGENAALLLARFRDKGMPVVHVQHESLHEGATFFLTDTPGLAIHDCVKPVQGEPVVIKHRPNAFVQTRLSGVLRELGVNTLVICGMMTNMCVDAGVRAASDLGYNCVLVQDACAAADLGFGGVDVPAAQVHAAFVAALDFAYAQVVSCREYLDGK